MAWKRQRSFAGPESQWLAALALRRERLDSRGESLVRSVLRGGLGMHPFVRVRSGRAIDEKTQQFWPTVVAARVHQLLAPVDAREVEVGDDNAFTGADGVAKERSVWRHDRRETTAGYR